MYTYKKASDILKECAKIRSKMHWTMSIRYRKLMLYCIYKLGFTYRGFDKWVMYYMKLLGNK